MPFAAPVPVPSPFLSSTRMGITWAPGATPSMPLPLPASAATMPVTCVPWPFSSWGVSSFCTKSWPGSRRPARSSCEASTPVSITATTAPEPVLVACAASASIVSSPHCCGRSGSPAASAAGARAAKQSSAITSASGVRMRALCPCRWPRTPLSGAYPLVAHVPDDLRRVARQPLARLVLLDEGDGLRGRVAQLDEVLVAAVPARLIAQHVMDRGIAAPRLATEQDHRAAAADPVRVLGRVLEQLLSGAGAAGEVDDAADRDRHEAVLADRVGEVLGHVRGELPDRLAGVEPRGHRQALCTRADPLAQGDRARGVGVGVVLVRRDLRELGQARVEIAAAEGRAEVGRLHHPRPATGDHEEAGLRQECAELGRCAIPAVVAPRDRAPHDP